ncbi:MAG: hypothetical protein U0527_05535 [Candidatus Eisenbacteria bacterium]
MLRRRGIGRANYTRGLGALVLITASLSLPLIAAAEETGAPAPFARDRSGRFKQQLRGLWVQKEYVDALRSEHSPFRASELLTGVTDLRYDSIAESLVVGINHHEWVGGPVALDLEASRAALKQNPKATLGVWKGTLEGYDVAITAGDSDTTLRCTGFDGTWTLTRVGSNPARTLQEFVQAQLLGGRFVVQDDKGQTLSRDLALYADGQIEGFAPYERFELCTDFIDDVPRMDTVVLVDGAEHETRFALKWAPETIGLYKLVGGGDPPNAASQGGQLVYTLIRLTDPVHVMGSE